MAAIDQLYQPRFGLLTDLYQLTMAYGYWKNGIAEKDAVFQLFFRKHPFDGGYAIAAGLESVLRAVERFSFDAEDAEYLRTLTGNDGKPLFDAAFIDYLRELRLSVDIDAVPEGTAVFAHEPLLRVAGPISQCQLLESMLLNLVNFQTLIATKASRVCAAANGEPVLEFGLRRAQGIDGSLSASRAAYIGGCAATSNVLAGKLFGIPVKGTHAHSWVMAFGDELESFRQYAEAMPNNCVFLVDTYDTIEGVKNAIRVATSLREAEHEIVGVRLDSGDLAELSVAARKLLDDAGFPEAAIVASNDLDEYLIASLKEQGARITVWGVGTKLATAYEQPALGGVYKLTAIRGDDGEWQPRIKLSEQPIKISNPGVLQVRRFADEQRFVGDVMYDVTLGIASPCNAVDLLDATLTRNYDESLTFENLLVPVFRAGTAVYESPPLQNVRERAKAQLSRLRAATLRRMNPQPYPVGLESSLFELKNRLIDKARATTT